MVESKDIIAIVNILRKVTRVVKVLPFVLALAYIMTMIGYMFCSDQTAILLDQLFYTSPLVVIVNFILSYALKLCKWHRLECALPIFPLFPLMVDYCVCPISKFGAIINSVFILLLILASLTNAYFVFIKPQNSK